jgi:hypothetical protein
MKTIDMQIAFSSSFPSHSEHSDTQWRTVTHSDTQLRYNEFSATAFISYIKTEFLASFLWQYNFSFLLGVKNLYSNFLLDGMLQASAQTIFIW